MCLKWALGIESSNINKTLTVIMLRKICNFLLNSCSHKLHCIRKWLYNIGISQWQSSANLQNINGIAISKTVRCAPSASAVSTSVNSQDYFPQLLTLRLKLFLQRFHFTQTTIHKSHIHDRNPQRLLQKVPKSHPLIVRYSIKNCTAICPLTV